MEQEGDFLTFLQLKWTRKQTSQYENLTRGLSIATTLSPALKFLTPAPTSTTSPATSLPVPEGIFSAKFPF